MEDDGIVVGVGHATAAHFDGRLRNRLRRGVVGQAVHFTRLAHVPVLAELAGEVAPRSPERQDRRARQEMMQRFLLDRIDTKSTGSPVSHQDDLILLPRPDETEPLLPFLERAIAWTEITLNAAVLQEMPVFRRRNGLHGAIIIPRLRLTAVAQFHVW